MYSSWLDTEKYQDAAAMLLLPVANHFGHLFWNNACVVKVCSQRTNWNELTCNKLTELQDASQLTLHSLGNGVRELVMFSSVYVL